ncbi:TELO2-interacting protein 2 [Liparis tanakae]|uniref:TELO2-interacting protein 2 n=1 Tax=Liparis tanakae TaxID=230148 RepID=A0A4Z2GWH9_9TELE|nr:TELO2-interacting protein 2 [Liparis tanakae]
MCPRHHGKDQAWTSSSSRAAAQSLQEALLRVGGWRDSSHLLMGDGRRDGEEMGRRKELLGGILDVLQPQLTKDSWHRCEAVKLVFAWTLLQPVLSCLLDLLAVLERPPSSLSPSSSRRTRCLHDSVLRLVLTHMEAEQKMELRRVYASALPPLIDRMGVAVCRHLRQVELVVLGYLEVRDPPEETSRLKVLEVLQITTRAAWPRMACRADALLRGLLRLLVAVSSDAELSVSVRRTMTDQTCLCLRLLDGCCHGDLQRVLQQVDSGCCSAEVLSCLATVTSTSGRSPDQQEVETSLGRCPAAD